MASRVQWKTWFGTGKKPTAGQFANVFDLLFKIDEDLLPINKVENLQVTLANKVDIEQLAEFNNTVVLAPGTTSWIVPAGTLLEILWVIEPIQITFTCGTTIGGNDIIEEQNFIGDLVYNKYKPFSVQTTIHFGGVTGNTIIKIFKR
jgi:hypothetical protein